MFYQEVRLNRANTFRLESALPMFVFEFVEVLLAFT